MYYFNGIRIMRETREGQSIRDTPKKLQTAGLDC